MKTARDEQKERIEMLRQDLASHRIQQSLSRTPNQMQPDNAKTYLGETFDDRGGRFAVAMGSASITGKSPVYDAPGKATNWNVDPVLPTEPLNQDVNWLEPIGEPHEIEEAQRIQDQRALEAATASVGSSPSDVEASQEPEQITPSAAPAHPLRRRKL